MANIVRTDPFQEIARFDPIGSFEDLATRPRLRSMHDVAAEPGENKVE